MLDIVYLYNKNSIIEKQVTPFINSRITFERMDFFLYKKQFV